MRKLAALLLAAVLVGAACTEKKEDPRRADEKISESALRDLQKAHPTPKFRRSQLRQNLVEIITAQAETTQTTTFFFNMGVGDPVHTCPSIGFPIPATAQLTNPQEKVKRHDLALPQVEPTGIYTGDSTGTYVICVDARGRAYADYWEGFIKTVTGPAKWDADAKTVALVGPPSFDFSEDDK
jgi:hypothetical protein